ncbi:MAG TPA: CBS domain-containing protein [Nitrospiria bacterium]|nr:CBS domain-containing protein [Nitrospiria bacterium]
MPIGEFCTKNVVTARGNETVADAAKKMSDNSVGTIIVVDRQAVPVGMITDRDITVRVVAEGKDPTSTRINEAMSEDPIVLNEERGIFEAVKTMCEQGVRRVPIVDGEGKLSGILSLDDLIMIFGEEMASIAGVVAYGSSRFSAKKIAVG